MASDPQKIEAVKRLWAKAISWAVHDVKNGDRNEQEEAVNWLAGPGAEIAEILDIVSGEAVRAWARRNDPNLIEDSLLDEIESGLEELGVAV